MPVMFKSISGRNPNISLDFTVAIYMHDGWYVISLCRKTFWLVRHDGIMTELTRQLDYQKILETCFLVF